MEFPYLVKSTDLGLILTPYCWIGVKVQNKIWRKHKFLFDTDADYTILPKYMSEITDFDIKNAKQEIMYTANNEPMVTFAGKIQIRIDNKELTIPCVFTDRDDTPFLLGRAGLIDRFEMTLSIKRKSLIFNQSTSISSQ